MAEQVTVESDGLYIDFHHTVAALCDDLRKMHERLCKVDKQYEETCRIEHLYFAEHGGATITRD